MKSAQELLDDLLREAKPPRDCAISLTEDLPKGAGDPNWIAGAGLMEQEALARYNAKFHELRDHCPRVDWSTVTERVGERRRIVKAARAASR